MSRRMEAFELLSRADEVQTALNETVLCIYDHWLEAAPELDPRLEVLMLELADRIDAMDKALGLPSMYDPAWVCDE